MALYRVTSEHYVKEWKDMLVSLVISDPVVAPSVGDYFRVVPCAECSGGSMDVDECSRCCGWLKVRLGFSLAGWVESADDSDQTGWVPAFLVHQGSTWYYAPVVWGPPAPPPPPPPPPPLPPTRPTIVARVGAPVEDFYYALLVEQFRSWQQGWKLEDQGWTCCLYEQLEAVKSDTVFWEALCSKAATYCDEFDWNVNDENKTSTLYQRMKFPPASITGPFPVEQFANIDEKEWMKYNTNTFADMQARIGISYYMTQEWENLTLDEDGNVRCLYHGTVWGAAMGMVVKGGFIPGPGKCKLRSGRKRSVQGAFCSTDFASAFLKGTGHQLDYAISSENGGKRLNILCMPVVVEICAVNLDPTRMHGSKYCFETPPGLVEPSVLPGVIITAIYINRELLRNFVYHHLQEPKLRPDLGNPDEVRVCGQNRSQFKTPMYQQTCGRILNPQNIAFTYKSGGGIWYCCACAQFICKGSDKIVYSLV